MRRLMIRIMAARTRLALATVELDRAGFQSALELAGQALDQFRNLSSIGGEVESLLLIGEVYFRQGFVQKALSYNQDALSAAKKINDRNKLCAARILAVEIYVGMGDTESASKLLKEVVEDVKSRRGKPSIKGPGQTGVGTISFLEGCLR